MGSPPGDPLARVRALCTALPETTEARTHGAPTWFVRRRSFAKFVDPAGHRLDQPYVALWAAAPPGVRQELVAAAPDRFFEPRFGGRGWVGVRLDGEPDWAEVREVVTDAYRQVAPKSLAARLDG
ncbi:phosphoribosylglycinamide formyltransferase [Pseudonocardia sp. CNS-139]|nr:phosphoribosylglycinamide formyltransferase [Pseudonocardia sp. CNS-139]